MNLVLPCDVVVEATDTGNQMAAIEPHDLMNDTRSTALAEAATQRLRAAITTVGG